MAGPSSCTAPLAKQIPLLVLLVLLTLSECGRHYYPDGANRFSTV